MEHESLFWYEQLFADLQPTKSTEKDDHFGVSDIEKDVKLPLSKLYYPDWKEIAVETKRIFHAILLDYFRIKKIIGKEQDIVDKNMDLIHEKLNIAEKSELAYLLTMVEPLTEQEKIQLIQRGISNPTQLLKDVVNGNIIGDGYTKNIKNVSPDDLSELVSNLYTLRMPMMVARYRSFFKDPQAITDPMLRIDARMLGDWSRSSLIGKFEKGFPTRYIARYPVGRENGVWHGEKEVLFFPFSEKTEGPIQVSIFAYGYDGGGWKVHFLLKGHQGESYNIIGIYGEDWLSFSSQLENPVKIEWTTLIFNEEAKRRIAEWKIVMSANKLGQGFDEVGFVIATNSTLLSDKPQQEKMHGEQYVGLKNEFESGKSDFLDAMMWKDGFQQLQELSSYEVRNISGELLIWVDSTHYLDDSLKAMQLKKKDVEMMRSSLLSVIQNKPSQQKHMLQSFVETNYQKFIAILHNSSEHFKVFKTTNQREMQKMLAQERFLQTLKLLIESDDYEYFIKGAWEAGNYYPSQEKPRITLEPKFSVENKIAQLSIHNPFTYIIGWKNDKYSSK